MRRFPLAHLHSALLVVLLSLLAPSAFAFQASADTIKAGPYDNGKMWTFEHAPADYFAETYGIDADAEWFEAARLGALRIPSCSASFASPYGLVLTNHHCARTAVTKVTKDGENLLDDGYYATSLTDERRVPDYYADQLVQLTDVTDEVYAALEGMETDAEKAQARQDALDAIQGRILEEAGGEEAGYHVEVISLYHGGQYSAYTFRRYDDVRLVMTPELKLGYFGGDTDNFTFPRYTLDMTLFRVYEDDAPLRTANYFQWNTQGTHEGEPVFVVGNPGSTSRLETVAQLQFRRDVQDKAILDLIESRVDAMQAFYDANPAEGDAIDLRNEIFSLKNGEKLYTGRLKALNDAVVMGRRMDTEAQFRAALAEDEGLQAEYGGLLDEMARIQEEMAVYAPEFAAFLALQPESNLSSSTFRRAILGFIYAAQRSQGVPASALAGLRDQLLGIEDQPQALQAGLLAARLNVFVESFGAESELMQRILQGRTPEAAAADIVAQSALADSASTAASLSEGAVSTDEGAMPQPAGGLLDDPAVQLAAAVFPRIQAFQSAFAGLGAQQQEVASALGRARFAVYGTDIPPDATFSLRIADGVVQNYSYNGTIAPAYTTFFGMYDRFYGHQDAEWDLPERWITPPASFDLETPLNLVTTVDIIGGNSGSPLLNKDLELVGLVFDGNIESLSGDYIYLPERGARSIAVDVRGMLEALGEIYDADRLVLELTTGTLAPTEAEADAQMSPAGE